MGAGLIREIALLLPNALYGNEDSAKFYEARLILENVTGLDYTSLHTASFSLSRDQEFKINSILEERSTGKPLAYILHETTFHNIELYVDERVLIPRSETELLVEQTLQRIVGISSPKILEIGVGSGAISLSIANENESATIFGVDISRDALDVADRNRNAIGGTSSRVQFFESDLFNELDVELKNSFDIIVSNPPYIGEDERSTLPSQVLEFEPHLALFAGESGFTFYKKILEASKYWLKDSGLVLFELSSRQVPRVIENAKTNGYSNIEIVNDLIGNARIAVISF